MMATLGANENSDPVSTPPVPNQDLEALVVPDGAQSNVKRDDKAAVGIGIAGFGFFSGLSLFIGLVVGSGIFSSPGPVFAAIGSFHGSLIMWCVAGLVSLVGALCYAELGTVYTDSGGDYVYMFRAFGTLPSFLFSFSGWVTRPASVSILALVVSQYILPPIMGKKSEELEWEIVFMGVALIVVVTGYSVFSRVSSKWIQNILCVIKVPALCAISITGFYYIIRNKGYIPGNSGGDIINKDGTTTPILDAFAHGDLGRISRSFYLAMWGYDGWSSLNIVSGQMKNPSRDISRVLIVGIGTVTALYILTNIAYFALLTPNEFVGVDAVSKFGENAYGKVGKVITTILVSISTYGALDSTIFCNSELAFITSVDNYAPEIFAYVHPRFRTPVGSLIAQSAIAVATLLIFRLNYDLLVTLYTIPVLFFNIVTALALIYLRKRDLRTKTVYKAPFIAPYLFIVTTTFMLAMLFVDIKDSPVEIVTTIVLFIVGTILWYFFIKKACRFKRVEGKFLPTIIKVPEIYKNRIPGGGELAKTIVS